MKVTVDNINVVPEAIGNALKSKTLKVPANQREYAWKDRHVDDLLNDLEAAIQNNAAEYFLGSIVAIAAGDEQQMIVDGQQRLATSLMLLATVRDYHDNTKDPDTARRFEERYLLRKHYLGNEQKPNLYLNEIDREYFYSRIILPPADPRRKESESLKNTKLSPSHRLIDRAGKRIAQKIANYLSEVALKHRPQALDKWVDFLDKKAKVIWVTVPDESSAYLIFETMNDRGLELSASDLIKNYIFGRVDKDDLDTAKSHWTLMVGTLSSVAGTEVKDYVRHYWVSRHNVVRSQELFNAIREEVKSPEHSLSFAKSLSKSSGNYVALLNSDHPTWARYQESAKKAIKMLQLLGVKQTRPSLLAAMEKMRSKEASALIVMILGWSVRLLAAGTQGSGDVESAYGLAAERLSTGKISKAKEVADVIVPKIVPKDEAFAIDFSTISVGESKMARYYLRAMERALRNESEPYFLPNDEEGINREHIMPEERKGAWLEVPENVHAEYVQRLGNFVLMPVKENSKLDTEGWPVKKKHFSNSQYLLTKEVSKFENWGAQAIETHQRRLAEIAVKTWPLGMK